VLSEAGRLHRWKGKESLKGTGFVQPLGPHEHWHTDLSYLNICATFYYLCSILDGIRRGAPLSLEDARRLGLESTEFEQRPLEIDNRTFFVGQWN